MKLLEGLVDTPGFRTSEGDLFLIHLTTDRQRMATAKHAESLTASANASAKPREQQPPCNMAIMSVIFVSVSGAALVMSELLFSGILAKQRH